MMKLTTAALLLTMAACQREPAPPATAAQPPPTPAAEAVAPAPPPPPPEDPKHPLPDESLYELEVELTDQEGRKVGLDAWRGHPTIVTMFYATCPAACPRLIEDIQAIERQVPPAQRDQLRVLMVSFDPERDTPAALTELARTRDLPLARWRLAATSESQAREIAAVLGIKYRRLDDGEFFHTSVITLLAPDGHALARVEGLGRDPAAVLAKLK